MESARSDKLHVGVIMDGNGRWAQRRGLPRLAGHAAGVEAARRLVEAAPKHGIGALTLYAFSSDNWRRPPAEVAGLVALMRRYLRVDLHLLIENRVRFTGIGRRDRIPRDLRRDIERAEQATADGDALHLRIAIDYSARDSILEAAHKIGSGVLDRVGFSRLLTGDSNLRDVDLVIRTSGEKRLSDFLLWESAYAELYFTDRLWPDFNESDLAQAVADFHTRSRRYGGLAGPAGTLLPA